MTLREQTKILKAIKRILDFVVETNIDAAVLALSELATTVVQMRKETS